VVAEPDQGLQRPILVNVRLTLVLTLAGCCLVGCGDAEGTDPTPAAQVTGENSAVRLVDEAEANLVLYASNQSFDDEEVRLTIAVDGATVVDGDFHVEGQHNWVSFPLSLSPGAHEITAESDSGATMQKSFRVPGDQKRYAVIDYWTEDGGPDLEWLIQRQPLAFA
jgi:hypothetical protein